ncbi:MAG: FHA domain-containing serine/threonine-protein kinase [Gemmataceae bacterium]
MPTRTLVIDGTDLHHFLLAVESGTVRLGDGPAHTAGLIRDLRVVRVRCEVEFEDDRGEVPIDEPGVLVKRALGPGGSLRVGSSSLSMAGTALVPALAEETEVVPALPAAGPRRLKVIDGGDQGHAFRLPDSGTVTVGKSGGSADIGLHDLYVSRVHCTLAVSPAGIVVTHVEGIAGTLIDGKKINGSQELKRGGVLRVGNSHLRLELAAADEPPAEDSKQHKPVRAEAVKEAAPELPPVGHYKLGRSLGRGFTGEVFEATHDTTGQTVALKLLAAEFPGAPAELEAFARELKAAQAVKHPNLIALSGAGRTPAGCWVAREFVPGESAAAVAARVAAGEKPSWTRAARVAVHLGRALEALHRHHVFHGNITPANVLLRADDHATKLTDLRLNQALAGSALHTRIQAAKLLAELPYMAPEQADAGAFVDESADLYAVGAVAYALVTGRPPVGGATHAEVVSNLHAGRVTRPGLVYKKVPAAFDAVVMKLLAVHQEDRYATAAQLLADLAPIAEEHDIKLG